jgi:hypothetical protein
MPQLHSFLQGLGVVFVYMGVLIIIALPQDQNDKRSIKILFD